MRSIFAQLCLVCMIYVGTCPASEVEVTAGVNEFLAALHNLDIPRIQKCFSEDASAFHHAGDPKRLDSKAALRGSQERVFEFIREEVRKTGRTSPPYHDVGATDVRVQMLSENAAVATFHMPTPTSVRRASFAFAKRGNEWKIVHMHISTRGFPK